MMVETQVTGRGRSLADELQPIGATRILDMGGVRWIVKEVREEARGRSLIFSSTRLVRRVRHFPDDWRRLPDAALFAVSWER